MHLQNKSKIHKIKPSTMIWPKKLLGKEKKKEQK